MNYKNLHTNLNFNLWLLCGFIFGHYVDKTLSALKKIGCFEGGHISLLRIFELIKSIWLHFRARLVY